MIIQTFYISSGAKNAMYTLRLHRIAVGQTPMPGIDPDWYLCNLAMDEDRAVAKASEYVEQFKARTGTSENIRIEFNPIPEISIRDRRGKFSAKHTAWADSLDALIIPFGKHAGKAFADLPRDYVLYFADRVGLPFQPGEEKTPIMDYACAAMAGYAMENGYMEIRQQERDERKALDEQSNFIGEINERRDFDGQVVSSYQKDAPYGLWVNVVRCGLDLVEYYGGKSLGDKGSPVKFRATIAIHKEWNGVKKTCIKRPMSL